MGTRLRTVAVVGDLRSLRGPSTGVHTLTRNLDRSARHALRLRRPAVAGTALFTALLGRALPRDHLDVASALDRCDRGTLLRLGFERDPGLSAEDAAGTMHLLDRLPDGPFADHGLSGQQVAVVRVRSADWPRDAADDTAGELPGAARRGGAGTATCQGDVTEHCCAAPVRSGDGPRQARPDRSRRPRRRPLASAASTRRDRCQPVMPAR